MHSFLKRKKMLITIRKPIENDHRIITHTLIQKGKEKIL
jgi:hypothetical protein